MKMVIITGYAQTEMMAERNVKLAFYTARSRSIHAVYSRRFSQPCRVIYGSGTTTNENGQLITLGAMRPTRTDHCNPCLIKRATEPENILGRRSGMHLIIAFSSILKMVGEKLWHRTSDRLQLRSYPRATHS